MNSRDPFNLRSKHNQRPSPFTILRASASHSINTAVQKSTSAIASTTKVVAEAVIEAREAVAEAAHESMSFAVPRNVPQFTDPQRKWEDAAWSHSGSSKFSKTGDKGVMDRAMGVFAERRNSLPMYKDKPAYHSGRSRSWWRRRRYQAVIAFVLVGLFYWFGWSSDGKESKNKPARSGWSLFGSSSIKVDWDWRRDKVRDAFKLSWKAYEDSAWGFDEFYPVQKRGRQMVNNGMGWIIVDALDTLILMNLTAELTHAREWVSTTLDYDIDHDVNTFETTIRMLGGLLSAHYLSTKYPDMAPIALKEGSNEDDLYLEKATDLADRLLGAYESHSGIPYASVNLHHSKGIRSHADGGASSTAEATTLQLEMKYLAQLTGEVSYWEKAEQVMKAVDDIGAQDGLVPIFVNPDTGSFSGNNIRLGSRGDSYYEYLIKQYLQTSKQEPVYLDLWDQALQGVRKHLITYSYPSNLTVLAERQSGLGGGLTAKMDHLVCFMPGTIALAATEGKSLAEAKQLGWTRKQEDDMELARQLTKTCWGMYKHTATGLAPEIAYFHTYDPPRMMPDAVLQSPDELDPADDADWRQDYDIHAADRHNLQRPETAESLFYMWRITGDIRYREWGWEMFQSFVKHTITEDGTAFSSINDVTKVPPPSRDNMESFWLAETLKYFYLLFSPDDLLPLDQVVFNTEAHPFPIFELGKLFKTGWERKPRDKDGFIVPEKKSERTAQETPKLGEHVRTETRIIDVHKIEPMRQDKIPGAAPSKLDPITGETET